MGYVRNESICKVINDLKKHVSFKEVAYITVLSLFLLLFLNEFSLIKVRGLLNSIVPNLLGFSIASYTVLFGINANICIKADDGEEPFEVLHASFVFGLMIEILALILDIMLKCVYNPVVNFTLSFILFFSIIWTLNMILHLYALRTFIRNPKKE